MRNPPLDLHVVQAAVSDVDDDGIAVINCQTTSRPRGVLNPRAWFLIGFIIAAWAFNVWTFSPVFQ
jgi:hypothetical protein